MARWIHPGPAPRNDFVLVPRKGREQLLHRSLTCSIRQTVWALDDHTDILYIRGIIEHCGGIGHYAGVDTLFPLISVPLSKSLRRLRNIPYVTTNVNLSSGPLDALAVSLFQSLLLSSAGHALSLFHIGSSQPSVSGGCHPDTNCLFLRFRQTMIMMLGAGYSRFHGERSIRVVWYGAIPVPLNTTALTNGSIPCEFELALIGKLCG